MESADRGRPPYNWAGGDWYSVEDVEQILNGEDYLRKQFPNDAERQIAVNDMDAVVDATETVIDKGLYQHRVSTLSDIQAAIRHKHPCISFLDWNTVTQKNTDTYSGHAVVITGYDEEHVYVHDPSPEHPAAHRRIETPVFREAWTQQGADRSLILVKKTGRQ